MSSAQPEAEVYPSFASFRRRETLPRPSTAAMRLIWTLDGSLTSLKVMNEGLDPDAPLEPYFQQRPEGTGWHAIAEMPVTRHKISSVTVNIRPFERWAEDWEESHRHAEPGIPGCIFGEAEDDETDPPLLMCCGEERPRDTAPVLVRASAKPYLRVHDYMSVMHPWLMERNGRILAALGVWDGRPLPADTKLAVRHAGDDSLSISLWEEWLATERDWANTPIVEI
ncbi:hypothetical protein LLEC1_05321 [Akanthomyces lecanii]|uniref:Uncharacterized protein n=1 Tax=Cordyceps confragosa TaxID=2714763 RepID=A0A179I5M5_CORDF|nr:hypothetical protein LLEC1_05321 [Akanthomyces lecanii]